MSREETLRALRRATLPAAELPSSAGDWTIYPDPVAQFIVSLAAAGGMCLEVGKKRLQENIEEIAKSVRAHRIVSLVSDRSDEGPKQPAGTNLADYQDVDLAVCSGTFGVAENGAVWLSDAVVPEPALLFLAQHLILTLDRGQILHNMHEAYERLSFDRLRFGTFIAGPSKTADIEQSLVIGAHGPRSLTVLLLSAEGM